MNATLSEELFEAAVEETAVTLPCAVNEFNAVERRRAEQAALETLRLRMVTGAVERAEDTHAAAAIRWAGADAVAIAAQCDLPLLVFPELFEEKRRDAVERAHRQMAIWGKTRRVLARALPVRLREIWGTHPQRTTRNGTRTPKSGLIMAGSRFTNTATASML